ncbi:MBL fold metallo-hydrolase [Streptomyces parvulus]|uniref:MBL fold metallo-hydrolase n=1 Tax=Streptomyces parvulus TaxID=146923 RepID=A0A369V0Y2_9ACTN|nr:MBL fold metallo-hydrolase [Streptomyces parvulus]RDD86441.1 MBL fold metallo-hydrolase [Streptomyces parvulus]
MATRTAVRRLDPGYFVRPAEETGGPRPRVEPVLAHLVRHERGLLLFDTGMGAADDATEAYYRPRRRALRAALSAAGAAPDEITLVVNCHPHFDHCGGNPQPAGRPVLVRDGEPASARAGGHTFQELVDFPGAVYEELSGEAEVWPGVRIVPTPGHTEGHQSLVVARDDGTVILAGQAHDSASEFGSDQPARLAAQAGTAPPLPEYPPWPARIAAFDPRRVLFAHDCSAWEPSRPPGIARAANPA